MKRIFVFSRFHPGRLHWWRAWLPWMRSLIAFWIRNWTILIRLFYISCGFVSAWYLGLFVFCLIIILFSNIIFDLSFFTCFLSIILWDFWCTFILVLFVFCFNDRANFLLSSTHSRSANRVDISLFHTFLRKIYRVSSTFRLI